MLINCVVYQSGKKVAEIATDEIHDYLHHPDALLHMIEPPMAISMWAKLPFAGPNCVLSVRSHAENGFQELRARGEREPELLKQGSGYVLYALMDAVVDRYFPLLDRLENDLGPVNTSGRAEQAETKALSAKAPQATFAI